MTKDTTKGTAEERTKVAIEMRRRSIAPRVPRPPNWAEWSKEKSAPLWEVVAVSCGYDPNDLRGWKRHVARCPAPESFLNRLRRAKSLLAIYEDGSESKTEGDRSDDAIVELGNFRAWLEHDGITLPPEFPKHAAKSPPSETPAQRKQRLTRRVAEIRATGKANFIAHVAMEEGITPGRVHQIIAKK